MLSYLVTLIFDAYASKLSRYMLQWKLWRKQINSRQKIEGLENKTTYYRTSCTLQTLLRMQFIQ